MKKLMDTIALLRWSGASPVLNITGDLFTIDADVNGVKLVVEKVKPNLYIISLDSTELKPVQNLNELETKISTIVELADYLIQ